MKAFGINKIYSGFIYAFCGVMLVLSSFSGSAQAAGSYDYNSDNDVDGQDIFEFIKVFDVSDLENFASSFGRIDVSACRALLPCNIAEANVCFQNAVATDPDPVVKTFHAVTRILALVHDENINSLLTELGLEEETRTLCNWTATWQRDENDEVVLPPNLPSTGNALNVLMNALLPEINGALDELDGINGSIDDPFIVLCEELTLDDDTSGCEDIEVDYGDVALYRAALQGMKAFLLIVDAYNWNVEETAEVIGKLKEDIFVINDYLCDDSESATCLPNLFTLNEGAATLLSQAKQSLDQSIESYFEASAYIRGETDGQENDTFAFSEASDEAAEEEIFRAHLAQIQDALTGPKSLTEFSDDNPITLDLSLFFDTPTDLRDFMPEFTDDNQPVCDSFDPELGGILPGFNSDEWAEIFAISVPVSGEITGEQTSNGGDILVKALSYWNGTISGLPYASEKAFCVLSAPGSYQLFLESDQDAISMVAFQDTDADGRLSPGDLYGTYDYNPFDMSSENCLGPAGIDINLSQTILGVKGTVTGSGLSVSNVYIDVYESGTYWNYMESVIFDNTGTFTFNTFDTRPVNLYISYYSSQYISGWWTGSGVSNDQSEAAEIDVTKTDKILSITLETSSSLVGAEAEDNGVATNGTD